MVRVVRVVMVCGEGGGEGTAHLVEVEVVQRSREGPLVAQGHVPLLPSVPPQLIVPTWLQHTQLGRGGDTTLP